MLKHLVNKEYKTITVEAEPICGEDFCDICGDCLVCYADDPCKDGGDHVWVEYDMNGMNLYKKLKPLDNINKLSRDLVKLIDSIGSGNIVEHINNMKEVVGYLKAEFNIMDEADEERRDEQQACK